MSEKKPGTPKIPLKLTNLEDPPKLRNPDDSQELSAWWSNVKSLLVEFEESVNRSIENLQ
jgi:hypothetical protein